MQISWGIIGCGDVTEVKSGPGFQQAEGSRLVAVMRRNADKAKDYAERHSVPFWSSDAAEVINHPEVNAVYIATPPGSHLDYALQVCAAGKPAYVEKPMARNATECIEMTEAFDRAGLPLFVAFYRRALPRFLKAKELIESGRIGVVSSVAYRFSNSAHRSLDPTNLPWRWIPEESGGGLFLDLGCHTLDILDFMLGPLENVSGDAANIACPCDAEDTAALQFRLPSGGLGTASWNFASDRYVDLIELGGTDGQLTLSTFGNEPVELTRGSQRETFDLPNPRHIQQPFIQTIVRHLNGQDACPSTGVTATRTARVMDAALSRYYGGRDDPFWTRQWPGARERAGR